MNNSPCVGVCQLLEDEPVCAGCFRTMSEIANWLRLSESEKARVLDGIQKRKTEHGVKTVPPPPS